MKGLAVLVMLLITVFHNVPEANCAIGDSVIDLLEEFRKRMCHPIAKWGLPPLDPFQISYMEYSINNKYFLNFTGSVTDLNVTGVSDFVINEIRITTFPLQRFTFDLTFPLTALKSLYTAKGSIAYVVNLAGDGNARASIGKLRIIITGSIRLGLTVGIRNLKIVVNIGGIEVDFENLFETERINDFFHAMVNEIGLELLDDAWKFKSKHVEDNLETKINAILRNYTLNEIIGIIGGGGGGPIFGPNDPPGDCKIDKIARNLKFASLNFYAKE